MNFLNLHKLSALWIQISLLSSCAITAPSPQNQLDIVGDWRDLETKEEIYIRVIDDKLAMLDFLDSGQICDLIIKDIGGNWYLFFSNASFNPNFPASEKGVFLLYRIVPNDDYFVFYEYSNSYLGREHLNKILTGEATLDLTEFSYGNPQVFMRIHKGRRFRGSSPRSLRGSTIRLPVAD